MLVSIGYENYVNKNKIVAVIDAKSSPSKRMIDGARKSNFLVDATLGKKTNALVVMESGHIVLSHNMKDTLLKRINNNES